MMDSNIDEWNEFIDRLSNQNLARTLRAFWNKLQSLGTPLPSAILDEVDSFIQLAWDREEHHLDIDLFVDGSLDWFYRNRATDEMDSNGDDKISEISDDLVKRLQQIIG